MTPEQLAEIEQRVNATPRGPWIIQYHGELGRMQWIRSDRDEVIVAETADHDDRRPIPEFIAHAREDVPALVAEVKRLTAERDADRAEIVQLCQERLRLVAERDEARAAIGFVRALADEWEQVINEGCFSADWIACLRANLPALRDAIDGSGS